MTVGVTSEKQLNGVSDNAAVLRRYLVDLLWSHSIQTNPFPDADGPRA